jgi:polysaccharide pyruvyl transferase WcaK-like protein
MKARKNKPKTIAFFGHFDSSNFGNESTLQAILYHLRRFSPCITTGPEAAIQSHQIRAVRLSESFVKFWIPRHRLSKLLRRIFIGLPTEVYRWYRSLSQLRGTDMMIVPGTGLLTDAYGLIDWGPYSLLRWSLAAKLCRCKLLFVSVGGGPVYGEFSKYIIRTVLRLADFRSYRDYTTVQHLRDIGVRADNDPVYPDLVFSLPKMTILNLDNPEPQRLVVGLGVMNYAGRYSVANPSGLTYSTYLEELVILAKWLISRHYDVKLLIGDAADNDAKQKFKDLLRKQLLGCEEKHIIDEPISSVQDLLSQIATTNFVVATRFHNIVMSLICNKPVISVSFHHKCESLMRAVDMSDYCLDMNDLTAKSLINKFSNLERNADDIKQKIGDKTELFRQELDEQYRLIFSYL